MAKVATAWVRAARSLMRPDIFWHMLWPTFVAVALWIVAAVLVWNEAASLLLQCVQSLPWMGHWFATGSTQALALTGLAHVILVLLVVPLSLLTAAVLIATLALPLMLDRVAASDYPDLVPRHGGNRIGSVANALWALLLFVMVSVVSLPLWFIPGMGIILTIALR